MTASAATTADPTDVPAADTGGDRGPSDPEPSSPPPAHAPPDRFDRTHLAERFEQVRRATEAIAAPLAPEDQVVQSMPDVSPTKWHRAHTTWFFETFVLPRLDGYRSPDPAYAFLFNSYYEQVGPRHTRSERGLLSRPTVAEVGEYRRHVDAAVAELVGVADERTWAELAPVLEIGLHHEQQHQELALMDIKHVLSCNPLQPAYRTDTGHTGTGRTGPPAGTDRGPAGWIEVAVDDDVACIGVGPGDGYSFDNEGPRHRALVPPFRIADRLVTCGEWLAFMDDGGYQRAELWLSDGWATVQQEGWDAPLYWSPEDDGWVVFTLHGPQPVDPAEPVCHISFFEADAFARWADARLPGEPEWEVAALAHDAGDPANDVGADRLHPAQVGAVGGPADRPGLHQLHGDVWEWTASPYRPYPGFAPAPGAIGEYNGKFMCNQMVLRGGACVTPAGHTRPTYRNFFPPQARWAFGGLRLARDA